MLNRGSKGTAFCDYCKSRHQWPRHCRQCGKELTDKRTLYCGGVQSPCGLEWGFTHFSWAAVRDILLKERGAICEVCGKVLHQHAHVRNGVEIEAAEIHHVFEVDGGPRIGLVNRRQNLLVLCHDCHQWATFPPKSPVAWVVVWGRPYAVHNAQRNKEKVERTPAEQLVLLHS